MPKEVCAEVMFEAVEEYSANARPQQGFTVIDIRFVNIDDATVKVFRDEFVKRYGSSQDAHPENHSSFQEDKGKFSPHSPQEKEVGKLKNYSKRARGTQSGISLGPG